VRLNGRIDRIDYHEGRNEWALFDYKTSERAAPPEDAHRTRRGEWTALQLPLYHAILPHVVDGMGRRIVEDADAVVSTGYITLCGDPSEIEFRLAEGTPEDLAEALQAARAADRHVRETAFSHVRALSSSHRPARARRSASHRTSSRSWRAMRRRTRSSLRPSRARPRARSWIAC